MMDKIVLIWKSIERVHKGSKVCVVAVGWLLAKNLLYFFLHSVSAPEIIPGETL